MYVYAHVFACVWARARADPVLEAEAEVHAKPSPSKTAELTETGTPLPLSKTPPPPPLWHGVSTIAPRCSGSLLDASECECGCGGWSGCRKRGRE